MNLAVFVMSWLVLLEPKQPDTFRVVVKALYDGDTITACDIEVGLTVWLHGEKIRLLGINAPEMTGATKLAGQASKARLEALLKDHDVVVVINLKDTRDKYGRFLGTLWVKGLEADGWCPVGTWCDVNAQMIASGQAVPYLL